MVTRGAELIGEWRSDSNILVCEILVNVSFSDSR